MKARSSPEARAANRNPKDKPNCKPEPKHKLVQPPESKPPSSLIWYFFPFTIRGVLSTTLRIQHLWFFFFIALGSLTFESYPVTLSHFYRILFNILVNTTRFNFWCWPISSITEAQLFLLLPPKVTTAKELQKMLLLQIFTFWDFSFFKWEL